MSGATLLRWTIEWLLAFYPRWMLGQAKGKVLMRLFRDAGMSSIDKPKALNVRVVLADEVTQLGLQAKRDSYPHQKMPQVTGGIGSRERFGEACFEILAEGESAGYLVERKKPILEIYRLFIYPDFRDQGVAKKAVYSWRSLRLMNGYRTVQLEIDDESAGFWQNAFPWYDFDYQGVHPEVPLESHDAATNRI